MSDPTIAAWSREGELLFQLRRLREENERLRKPLTELQITEIYTKWESTKGTIWADLIRAIEAAHNIGVNT